ncbi:CBF-domain-containing protein [Lentinus tigrinus ALCF2SS1-7]|uniref:CBF-domain-containing protein n=1 Tax=Lentinus tigrinus ALCF2SS1-6 TaxID=1328759 RepID=A0A5C2SQY7_9APHY|nr:CBF-domain-containing protein [Lentinus tigrinus ALCF2SS1-6]RPD79723.1 CBF-domain-containing protein [Lentinus tigrinus ALCF2SS1-7]
MPPSLPSKKRKTREADDTLRTIQDLEKQLTVAVSNGSSLNPLADLLDIALGTESPAHLSKAIYALYRVFVVIITNGLLSGPDRTEEAKAVRAWLLERLHSFVDLLASLLKDEEPSLKTSSLDILFSLQKHLSSSLTRTGDSKQPPQFHVSHFRKIVSALLLCPPSHRAAGSKKRKTDADALNDRTLDPEVRDHFVNTWFSVNDDIRWFFLRDAAVLISKHSFSEAPQLPGNLLSILERLTTFPTKGSELNSWWVEEMGTKPPPAKKSKGGGDEEDEDEAPEEQADADEEDDWRKFFDEPAAKPAAEGKKGPAARVHTLTIHQSLHSLAAHRAVFTRAWLALLPQLSLGSSESTKAYSLRVLNVLHRGVIPHLTRPILIMDWVSSSVDLGGTVGLLALNALFTLMKEYNLDYPSFYTRLYGFLDRDVLHLKHRARFFRLTELFLSSTHLPANLVASFVKRLSRLSLNAPPAAIIMLIPFTYNMLRRHPALMAMIHRTEDLTGADCDGFDASEGNPNLTNALESSLWELYTHRQHYHASVSTLARIFEEAFTRPSYAMEDFLDHTYGTLFETEAKRKIRKEPATALELSQVPEADGLDELWTIA